MMDQEGLSQKKKESLMGRWMTMALITGHYQNSPDSVVVKDIAEIKAAGFESYLTQIEELRLNDHFFAEILPDRFTTTTSKTAPFLAFMAALCARDTKVLYSKTTSMKELLSDKAESCQILPKAYLEKCGFKTREIYGQVGNLTYINKEVKTIIKKKAPADYRAALGKVLTDEEISASLKEHGIPVEIFEADKTNVEEILKGRRSKIGGILKEYYYSI